MGDIVKEEEPKQEQVKEKSNIIPILAGIAVSLVIAIIVLAVIFIPRLFADKGAKATCPKFVEMILTNIKNNTEYTDRFIFTEKWDENNEFDYGYVYEQSIPEKQMVKDDTKITLYVSMGQSTKKVPDVYDQLDSYAKSKLEAAGFKVKIVNESSDEVEEGYVIRTEPIKTTVVAEGETITIFVSTGKPQEFVEIPDVVGQPESQAKEALQKAGLTVKVEPQKVNVTANDEYQPSGYVIKQSPVSSSEKVEEGTEVTLYISSGLYETDVEITLPKDFEEGKEICKVSLWLDGKIVKESEKIDLSKVRKYTFKGVTSSTKTAVFNVMINDTEPYQDISVDFRATNKNNIVTVVMDSADDLE